MSIQDSTQDLRARIRQIHLADERYVLTELVAQGLDGDARVRVLKRARQLIVAIRRAKESRSLAAAIQQSFSLNTAHGVALMQLAEALPRTKNIFAANALIADKLGGIDWRILCGDAATWLQRQTFVALEILTSIFSDPARKHRRFLRALGRSLLRLGIDRLSGQYLLGDTIATAIRHAQYFSARGYAFSFDMLGESACTAATSERLFNNYLDAIQVLAAKVSSSSSSTAAEHPAISVKLSALYPRFEEHHRDEALLALFARCKQLALHARAAQLDLTIDAEESERLELTLDVFERLCCDSDLKDWNGLGLAVQAYQRRAPAVLEWLATLAKQQRRRINIRLVKGAYWDTEIKRAQRLGLSDYPVFTRKAATDVAYLACARQLLSQRECFLPQFATHNAYTAAAVIELARELQTTDFEFQRLHGMGEALHDQLLRDGFRSRIYAPIGPRAELLPYLVRRLLENGASSSFVHQLFDPTIPLEQLLHDPYLRISQSHAPASAQISKPRNVIAQSWPSASGWDTSNRDSATFLLGSVTTPQTFRAAPYIDGHEQVGDARVLFNPALLTEVLGEVVESDDTHVEHALHSARAGFATWSLTSPAQRSAILQQAAQLLEEDAPQFIQLAVLEAGKTLDDAVAEVREAIDFCRYYSNEISADENDADEIGRSALQTRDALGVIACISPWNFPLAIFMGQIVGALAMGNTVLAKPAEQTPLIAMRATRLLHAAGIPTNVLHLLPGDGRVGAAIVKHAGIDGVCFTGSSATANAIAQSLVASGRTHVPLIAETGGVNAMIVDATALPEQVVGDILTSAFQSAGQRCSALRLLCVPDDTATQLLELLRGAMALLQIGDPRYLSTDIGPLIDCGARESIREYLHDKSQLLAQTPLTEELKTQGWFLAPTLLEVSRVNEVRKEVFGPVLHVLRYKSEESLELLEDINALGFGLTLGIHSRNSQRTQTIVDAARIGNIYVNRNQIGAVVGQQPFGGCGLSGTGPKAGGPHYLLRLSRPKTIDSPFDLISHRVSLVDTIDKANVPDSESNVTHELENICAAQRQWIAVADREALLSRLRTALQIEDLRMPLLRSAMELPAIAGERNTLYLRPRGVLLSVHTQQQNILQIHRAMWCALAAGNGLLMMIPETLSNACNAAVESLLALGLPRDLICTRTYRDTIPSAWLRDTDIDGVIFDGDEARYSSIAAELATRSGAILPLLSTYDDAYRFYLEQTVTINTAAAGGDPNLLESAAGI